MSVLLLVAGTCDMRGQGTSVDTAAKGSPASLRPLPLSVLEAKARSRISAQPRVSLDGEVNGLITPVDDLEPSGSGRIPNYVRAFSGRPGVPASVGHLMRVVLYSGSVRPETKMAMGIRVAQLDNSPYVAAYMEHMLRATTGGTSTLARLRSGGEAGLSQEERMALLYATAVSTNASGIEDSEYRQVRAAFDDSQMVELTLSVCFFNYFTRIANAFNLPVESWSIAFAAKPPEHVYAPPAGRVAVLDDSRLTLLSKDDASFKDAEARGQSSMGIGLPHGERIMLWCPDVPQAWWDYGKTLGPSVKTPRIFMRYTSLAVSTANACRYCTLHVLLGLRRAGVDPSKLLEMRTDDSVLTSDERSVTEFARKLTRNPEAIGDEDYRKVVGVFGSQGAADIVLQTSYFAFMNRFNDAMKTPSEDLAIQNYREIYGDDWQPSTPRHLDPRVER
jgi:alkylhydroperoxidase family enzyme